MEKAPLLGIFLFYSTSGKIARENLHAGRGQVPALRCSSGEMPKKAGQHPKNLVYWDNNCGKGVFSP
jgi:hypothetical protein